MKTVDYDKQYDENSGGTATHLATDTRMKRDDIENNLKEEEGWASAHGVRPETAASGGRIKHPETKDDSRPYDRVSDDIEEENPGLADS